MKKRICTSLIVLTACAGAFGQASSQLPPATPPPRTSPPGTVPPPTTAPNVPPNILNPSTVGPGSNPPATFPNPVFNPALSNALANTNAPMSTNQVAFSNAFGTNVVFTNAFGTNIVVNFAITNTLSAMSPAQAAAVRQVQAALDSLQTAAERLRNIPNVQQTIAQSPTMQQQLGTIVTEINSLAQGAVRPSQEIVLRLSTDLAQLLVSAQLTPDQHLVLSVVINQIVNSGNLNTAQVDESIATAQSTLQAGGAPVAVVQPVVRDLRSIAIELQARRAR